VYTVAVQREFIAQHFLTGGDFGPENHPHAHHYRVEVRVDAAELDAHGYLVDIDALNALLEALLARYRDRMLNEMPEFSGLNPSLEHLCRILCRDLTQGVAAFGPGRLRVRVWEGPQAWAAYATDLPCA
jgi:6-pyruvoyltetrahydropterin/6-carboxytetrahydropterin synthase